MKIIKTLFIAAFLVALTPMTAQTADEILDNYFENTGGQDNWEKVEAIEFKGSVDFQGMVLPVIMTQTKDGMSMMKAGFQGQTFYQGVYDGETLWSTNQMTMAAEKSDTEATANHKLTIGDFPDPLLNYKEKGYAVELIGNETIEGTETFKIQLTKKPMMVNGKEEADITYYYFDKENFVPIVVEAEVKSGPGAGMVSQTKMSDYQEVDGLYFPFSINEGIKDKPGGQTVTIKEIKINPEIDKAMFVFPEKN